VDITGATRLVGRICNLSQVEPALRRPLQGGYRVTRAQYVRRNARAPSTIALAASSPATGAWLELLDVTVETLRENRGVAMAPRLVFPSRRMRGTLTSVTDASGDDGVGGYAFHAETPKLVFVVAEDWPTDIKHAMAASASVDQAAKRRAGDGSAARTVSMPAAELIGQLLVPMLVARAQGFRRVYAVNDCAPAVRATDSMHSRTEQMCRLLAAADRQGWAWLAVHVHREANVDADRLSHPTRCGAVLADAMAAGLTTRRLRATWADWDLVRKAVGLPHLGNPEANEE
jgi:hypothetical protein